MKDVIICSEPDQLRGVWSRDILSDGDIEAAAQRSKTVVLMRSSMMVGFRGGFGVPVEYCARHVQTDDEWNRLLALCIAGMAERVMVYGRRTITAK